MTAAGCGGYAAHVDARSMVEVWAAVIGAVVGSISGAGVTSLVASSRRNQDTQIVAVRLTSAVENIAKQLEGLHVDIKEDRRETFGRIGAVEQRVSKLEAHHTS